MEQNQNLGRQIGSSWSVATLVGGPKAGSAQMRIYGALESRRKKETSFGRAYLFRRNNGYGIFLRNGDVVGLIVTFVALHRHAKLEGRKRRVSIPKALGMV